MCPLGIKFCCVLNVRTPPDARLIKERENVGHKTPSLHLIMYSQVYHNSTGIMETRQKSLQNNWLPKLIIAKLKTSILVLNCLHFELSAVVDYSIKYPITILEALDSLYLMFKYRLV